MPLNPRAFGPRLPAALEQFGPAQAPGGLAGVGQGLPEAKDDTLTGLGRLPTFGMAESGGVLPDTATGGGGGATTQAMAAAPAGVTEATPEEASGLATGFGVGAKVLGGLGKGLTEAEKDTVAKEPPPPTGLAGLIDQGPLTFGVPPLDVNVPTSPLVSPDIGTTIDEQLNPPLTLGVPPLDATLPDAPLVAPALGGSLPAAPEQGFGLERLADDLTLTTPELGSSLDQQLGGEPYTLGVAPLDRELPDLSTVPDTQGLGGLTPSDADLAAQAEFGDAGGGGITAGGLAGGLAGLSRIGQSLASDQSPAATGLGVAGGAAQTYNSIAGMAGWQQIPYLNWILGTANAVRAGIEAEDTGQAAANIGGSVVDSAFNAMFGPVSLFMGGHGFGDIIRSLYRPDVPHGVREAQELADVALPAARFAQYLALSTTPEELDAALAMAPQFTGLVLSPDRQAISVQAGVSPGLLDSTQQMLSQVLTGMRGLFAAAEEGVPEAQELVEAIARRRGEFLGAIQYAGSLPVDTNTGSWGTGGAGSLSSVSEPQGAEGALLNLLVFGGASPNAIYGGTQTPTGPPDPDTGMPGSELRVEMPMNIMDIASRIPQPTDPDWQTAGSSFVMDPERGTFTFAPGTSAPGYVRPPETEAEIAAAWEAEMERMRQQQGGG